MKSIEQASLENSKNHYIMAFSEELHKDADMDFRAGVEFAQRWIPVEEEMPEFEKQVIIKTTIQDDFYIAYLFYGQFHTVEKDDLIDLEQVIGWRPIEYK